MRPCTGVTIYVCFHFVSRVHISIIYVLKDRVPTHVPPCPRFAVPFCFPAGVATIAPILEATVQDWDWTMNVRNKLRNVLR